MFDFLLDFMFPKKCLGCGRWGQYICADCLNKIKIQDERICPNCGFPSLGGLSHPSCRRPLRLDGLTSIFVYQGIIKKAIIKFKYKFVTDLAETILELFFSFCGEDKVFTHYVNQENVCLTSVPLFWQRKNWRGFNQAELLGKMIASQLGIKFIPNLLIRQKNTRSQTKLTKKQRQKNIKGAFKINKNLVFNEKLPIILFDDVWTTGATMKEGAKILKRNHFQKVWGLTLARQTKF